jgi:hypothetical protein
MQESKQPDGIFFVGFPGEKSKPYPAWRYHEWLEPVTVQDTEEDEKVQREGWYVHNKPVTVCRHLLNQRFDLEDFSARQLVAYAKEEFGVDLPIEAGREKLFKTIWKLSFHAPENKDRVVLMAVSLDMNYAETQSEIARLADKASEVTKEVFYA